MYKRSEKWKQVALPCGLNWVSWRTEIISSLGGRSGNFSSRIDRTFSCCSVILSASKDKHLKRMLPETSKHKNQCLLWTAKRYYRNKNVYCTAIQALSFLEVVSTDKFPELRYWMLLAQKHPPNTKAVSKIWAGWLFSAYATANPLVPVLPRCAACFCMSNTALWHGH